MTTVPPPNVALPQVLAAATAPTTIVIPQPPPALAALPAGTTLEAVVVAPPSTVPPGSPAPPTTTPTAPTSPPTTPPVVLQTVVGDITVRLPAPLPANVPVDIEIVRSTPHQVTVRLSTIDGMPALQYLAQSRNAGTPPAVPAVPVAGAPPIHLPAGPQPLPLGAVWQPGGPSPFVQVGLVSAIVLHAPAGPESALPAQPGVPPPQPPAAGVPQASPAPATSPTPASPPTFAALGATGGSEFTLRIVSVQLPGAPAVSATPAPSAGPTPAIPSVPAVALAPQAPPAALPNASGPVLAGPQGLPPAPPQPPATVQPVAPLAAATGTVVTVTNAIPVIAVESAEVQINVRANLPVGTKIAFDVTAAQMQRVGAPTPMPAMSLPLSGPAGAHTGWPTLTESVAVLMRSDPVAAQQLAQAIPDGGARTAVAVLSFVQAMRSGDARQWPGDTSLRALERAGPRGAHLAATLSAEVAEMAARGRDSGAEWRALPIPWNAGGEIDRIALITRREGDSETEGTREKKGGGTRFLIDLNLSRLGPMQLDGMFKKETKVFDMVMRTKAALPDAMRRDLIGLFAESNAAMGLNGGLTFQVTRKFADPLGSMAGSDKSGLWA